MEEKKKKKVDIDINNEVTAYEDLRNKLKILEQDNQKINEQLFALQNKFYVQTKILNDKNAELSKEVSLNQKIKIENSKILQSSNEMKSQIDNFTKENDLLKKENEKVKKDLNEMTKKFNESCLKSNYLIGQLEEKNSNLENENTQLKESSSKLKTKLDFMFNDMKAKESKLIFTLKNENKQTEQNLQNEIINLRKENENLINESAILKREKESLVKEKESIQQELSTAINETKIIPDKSKNTSLVNEKVDKSLKSFNSFQSQHLIIEQLEKKVSELSDENEELKSKMKAMENNMLLNDKKLKAIKLDLNQSEKENKEFYQAIKKKKEEVSALTKENINLKCELEKGKTCENLMLELQEKNQTISFLLNQTENLKNQAIEDTKNFENKIEELKQNNQSIIVKLAQSQDENKQLNEQYEKKLNEAQRENEELIKEIQEKQKEYSELLNDKMKMETKYDAQFKQAEIKCDSVQEVIDKVHAENIQLKNQIVQCANLNAEKYNEINEKNKKFNKKLNNVMNVYDNHINILKERFKFILNDLQIAFFNKQTNPKELNEKFSGLVKSIVGAVNEISNLSEREALIENFKTELKSLKNKITTLNQKIKTLESENFDLNQVLNVKKLQMKIKAGNPNENYAEKIYYHLYNLVKENTSINELNMKISSLQNTNQAQKIEINSLKDDQQFLKDNISKNDLKINELSNQLSTKTRELNDLSISHKKEIKGLLDEVKKIKENWIPADRQNEYMNTIEEMEKTIKNLKDDIYRKKEIINGLRVQIKNDMIQNNNTATSEASALTDKIKSLKKDVERKDAMLREIKTNTDTLKESEKKLKEENESLFEKTKILKIDIQRKELIIKDLREKIQIAASESQTDRKTRETTQITQMSRDSNYQRLKSENERKENLIKTLRAKNEALQVEMSQIQSINLKQANKNTSNLEREQKKHLLTKDKLDSYSFTIDKMSTCIRRILKDLLNTYERERNKVNMNVTNTMKEGMNILGVTENEVNDFLNPNDDKSEIVDKINQLLSGDGKNFDTENAINIYNELKEKISQYQFNEKNGLGVESFSRTQNRNIMPENYFMMGDYNRNRNVNY